jgi:hypothetical protein
MRPIRVTLTAAGTSAPLILDHYRDPFSVGIAVTRAGVANPVSYSVEMTYDDVFSSTGPTNWFEVSGFTSPQTAAANGTISSPVTAVRLKVATITSPDTLTITVIQAGMPGL